MSTIGTLSSIAAPSAEECRIQARKWGPRGGYGVDRGVASKVAPRRGLTVHDRRFLASIIHQVWRNCQVFVTVAMERGPKDAAYALEELGDWAAAQRKHLTPRSTQRPRMVTQTALRVGRELLDDVDTICRRTRELLARINTADAENAEEEALGVIEGLLGWTGLMASQLGITRSLKPQMLWFER